MYKLAEQRVAAFGRAGQSHLLRDGQIGLEKESLRVDREGRLAQTPHPAALGSPLTNPYITTDYSEAQLELITPPQPDSRTALGFLSDVHQFVYDHLGPGEMLWATSMPCVLNGDENIPIAEYGRSNLAMMKTVYRRGLGYRYGRAMQVISGVHFNYSLSEAFWSAFQALETDTRILNEFISDRYFGLLRNLQRFGWLIPYLFGASPGVSKSFLNGKSPNLDEYDSDTYYGPYATSLRMGDIGYQNNRENEIGVKACYDSLQEYIDALTFAIETPYPGYQKLGVRLANGEYRQLNANILQIENEYYSTVRPKQLLRGNEKPTLALKRRGVRYIELRSLDINAFEPLGIAQEQLYFLEALTLFCLFHESPRISPWERAEIDKNEMAAAHRGRDPQLKLVRDGDEIRLSAWAAEICNAMEGVCELLDSDDPARPYSSALELQKQAVADPERTPSARMLREMRERNESFFELAYRKSREYSGYFQGQRLSTEAEHLLSNAAEQSLERQNTAESSDQLSFDEFLEQYFSQS